MLQCSTSLYPSQAPDIMPIKNWFWGVNKGIFTIRRGKARKVSRFAWKDRYVLVKMNLNNFDSLLVQCSSAPLAYILLTFSTFCYSKIGFGAQTQALFFTIRRGKAKKVSLFLWKERYLLVKINALFYPCAKSKSGRDFFSRVK